MTLEAWHRQALNHWADKPDIASSSAALAGELLTARAEERQSRANQLDELLLFVLNQTTDNTMLTPAKTKVYLRLNAEQVLSSAQLSRLNELLQSLQSGYPLAYLLGYQDFWDMRLRVNESVLIPRADTETLINLVRQLYPVGSAPTIVDLGTGSGAIIIALSRLFPDAQLTAIDLSTDALNVARENAKHWGKAPITFVQSHWLDAINQTFDCIVSNPPYIAVDDPHLAALTAEPQQALVAEQAGLADLAHLIQVGSDYLKPNGYLLLEHGYQQSEAVRALFVQAQWQAIQTQCDLTGNPRVTYAQKPVI